MNKQIAFVFHFASLFSFDSSNHNFKLFSFLPGKRKLNYAIYFSQGQFFSANFCYYFTVDAKPFKVYKVLLGEGFFHFLG